MAKKFLHYSKKTATFTDLAGREFIIEAVMTPDSVLVIKGEDEAATLSLTPEMVGQLSKLLELFYQRGVVVPLHPPKPELQICPECGKKKLNPCADWVDSGWRYVGKKCSARGCSYHMSVYICGKAKSKRVKAHNG